MKLVSMKLTKRKRKGLGLPVAADDDEPYPWGVRLTLDETVLQMLKKAPKDFNLGARVAIRAEAEVISLSSETAYRSGEEHQNVRLQIVKMMVE